MDKKANPPPRYIVQKLSEHGSDNPIVARLALQTMELVKWIDTTKEVRENIFGSYLELQRRLLQCHEYHLRLISAKNKTIYETTHVLERQEYTVPAVMNLEAELEGFLYSTKHFFRQVAVTMNLLFESTQLAEDSSIFWCPKGQYSPAHLWAITKFGQNHPLAVALATDAEWISELVKKRNAAEHPGGKSGTLIIYNFRQGIARGEFVPPVWFRRIGDEDKPATEIYRDLEVAMGNMLTFAEEMLIHAISARPLTSAIGFYEVPPEQRPPQAPVRFVAVMIQNVIPPHDER